MADVCLEREWKIEPLLRDRNVGGIAETGICHPLASFVPETQSQSQGLELKPEKETGSESWDSDYEQGLDNQVARSPPNRFSLSTVPQLLHPILVQSRYLSCIAKEQTTNWPESETCDTSSKNKN